MSAPDASGEAKEKAGLRTRSASRLSLVSGGNRIDIAQPQEEKAKAIPHRKVGAILPEVI